MNRWIFVISDSDEVFEQRVKSKKWTIFDKTRNKKQLEIGDMVLFYKAGVNGQKFLGTCKIKSGLKKETEFKDYLEINEILVLPTPVKIKDVIKELNFIKNKKNWGNYFQGGVRRISEDDLSVILKKGL